MCCGNDHCRAQHIRFAPRAAAASARASHRRGTQSANDGHRVLAGTSDAAPAVDEPAATAAAQTACGGPGGMLVHCLFVCLSVAERMQGSIACIFGAAQLNELCRVQYRSPAVGNDDPSVSLEGFVSKPLAGTPFLRLSFRVIIYFCLLDGSTARGTSDRIFFFVNDRPVQLPALSALILSRWRAVTARRMRPRCFVRSY